MTTPTIVSNKTLSELGLAQECVLIYHDHHILPYGHNIYNPTCIICVEYGTLVEDNWLEEVRKYGYRVYNIHRADPDDYRGASVLNHQILAGEMWADITLQELLPGRGIDQGPIIRQESVFLHGTYPEIRERCRAVYPDLIKHAILHFNDEQYIPQGRLYKRRKPEDSELLESDCAQEIFGKLLAADPDNYPCYFIQDGRKFYTKLFTPKAPPGEHKSP